MHYINHGFGCDFIPYWIDQKYKTLRYDYCDIDSIQAFDKTDKHFFAFKILQEFETYE